MLGLAELHIFVNADIGGMTCLVFTAILTMTLPANPAIIFCIGLVITVLFVFVCGLVPYTGVRLGSRVWWFGRLILVRKPVSASGMPIGTDSGRSTLFVDESIVVVLPDRSRPAVKPRTARTDMHLLEVIGAGAGSTAVRDRINGNGRSEEGSP